MVKPIIGIMGNQRIKKDINLPWSYAPTGFVKGVQRAEGYHLSCQSVAKKTLKPTSLWWTRFC